MKVYYCQFRGACIYTWVNVNLKLAISSFNWNKIDKKRESTQRWTLIMPFLRRLSNLFAIEISTVHVIDINLYTILVPEQLCQHWSFSCHPNGRYRRDRARFNKHAFFKALPLVFTCGIAAVRYYNSPKCHNYIIIKIMWYMMMF